MNKRDEDLAAQVRGAVSTAIAAWAPNRVLVAYSGGADSTALLLACHQLLRLPEFQLAIPGRQPPPELIALHANHGLQAAAKEWQVHCEAVCRGKDIDLRVGMLEVDPRGNTEAKARTARYAFFAEQLRQGDLLLLGHHSQDQAETVLLRLLQGRSIVPMRSKGRLGLGQFARPLLSFNHAQLCQFLQISEEESKEKPKQKSNQQWIEDDSNADLAYDRNFLRRIILPPLQDRWSGVLASIQRVAQYNLDVQQALAHEVAQYPDKFPLARIPEESSAALPWLRAYLQQRGIFDASDRSLAEFVRQLRAGTQAAVSFNRDGDNQAGGQAWLRVYRHHIYFDPPAELLASQVQSQSQLSMEIPMELPMGQPLQLPHGKIQLCQCERQDAMAMQCRGTVEARFHAAGESLQTEHGVKSLSELLRQAGVPPWRRDSYPLIYQQHMLVCVPEIAVVKATEAEIQGSSSWCRVEWRPRGPN